MFSRLIPLCLVLYLASSLPQGKDLDQLIADVFGENPSNPSNPPPIPQPPLIARQNDNNISRDNRGSLDDSDDCTCVPYYLCQNGTVLTDGTGLLDIRLKPGACEEYMDVCCKNPLDKDHPVKPPPTKRKGCGQRHPDGVGFRITGNTQNEAQFGEFPWMVALLKRTILSDGSDLMVYACGGALIHEKVVLTAAHCVVQNNDNVELLARAGEWDTQTNNEIFPHQNSKVSKVIIHPQFRMNNLHNDFALLILESPVTLGENIDTVCLPTSLYVPLSRECYATGWGKDKFDDRRPLANKIWRQKRQLGILDNVLGGVNAQLQTILNNVQQQVPVFGGGVNVGIHTILDDVHEHVRQVGSIWPSLLSRREQIRPWRRPGVNQPGEKGQYQVILKKIDLPIVPKDQCINLLRKTRLGPFYRLHDSFVCAGGIIGKDTCKGDGGSPLVCPVEGKQGTYEVTGLVSWGIGCGDETPGVYAGVAYARQWIDQELNNHGIHLES